MPPTSVVNGGLTVLVHHPDSGDNYAALIRDRFPNVRVVSAGDAVSLDHHIPEADILLAPRFPIEAFEKARRLRWFQCSSAGVDSILPVRDRIDELIVTNARGMQGEIIADFVMACITMLHWDFPQFARDQARREWHPRKIAPLAERTLGVIGLGSIGAVIARRGKSAGMTVIGSKRDITEAIAGVDKLYPAHDLAQLLRASDFVVLALPYLPETAGLIGRNEFELMRNTAYLVNVARGSVVVESDLVDALRAGTIAGAALDVFEREPLPGDSPLWSISNVIVSPHVAGNPTDYVSRIFEIFSDNLQRFLQKKPLRNVVDVKRGY